MGLFGTLFGSAPKSTSSSYNEAAPFINQTYQPVAQTGVGATNALAGLYGVGGDPAAQQQAFDQFRNSTGYNFALDQGSRAITGNAAARGLLNSGSTAQALTQYGQNLANQSFGNYANALEGVANNGLQAGQLIAGANQRSEGTSKGGSSGILGKIGQVAGGIASFSDARLKEGIRRVGRTDAGLPVYTFRYRGEKAVHMGVMAQDVAAMQPEALGPTIGGFGTVRYGGVR